MNKIHSHIMNDGQSIDKPPVYKLYNVLAVGFASYFGTCIAGGFLMSINWMRLGFPKKSIMTMLISCLVLFFIFLFQTKIFPYIPSVIINFPSVFLFMLWSHLSQGKLLKIHIQQMGVMESGWKVLAISIIFMFFVGAVSAFLLFYFSDYFLTQ
ncbi:hypothetical protein FHE25_21715 [Salmonella enterica]|nr:hypothetical protein [Salmonella enterica]EAV1937013.1 hypothetical protein [Salmonella enterica]EBB7504406.1 hypothetical protein [Salmonella enterica]EKH8225413.1 hypothetical protein [Salmonella enterica]